MRKTVPDAWCALSTLAEHGGKVILASKNSASKPFNMKELNKLAKIDRSVNPLVLSHIV